MDSRTSLRNKINTLICLDFYYRGYVQGMQKGKGYIEENGNREEATANALACPITEKVLQDGL
jgi:hypothetical protein